MKIGVLLAKEEPYSPETGGALSTWVNAVYGSITDYKYSVFSCKTDNVYPNGDIIFVRYGFLFKLFKKLPGRLFKILVNNYQPIMAGLKSNLKGIDVIHIHNRPTYVHAIKVVHPKCKVILHMQNDHLINIRDKEFVNCIKNLDGLISTSRYIENGILKRLSRFEDLTLKSKTVIYNGAFVPTAIKNDNKAEVLSILFIGRFVPEKGVLELVKSFSLLAEKYPQIHLDIVGGEHFGSSKVTPYIAEVFKEAEKFKNRITFHGHVPRNKLDVFFNNASIYVAPSIWDDPFPLSVIEGLAAKLPVISSKKGGIPEALDNGAGIILDDPTDIGEFTQKLELLVRDESLRDKLSFTGYNKFLKNYTWDKIAKDLTIYLSSFEPKEL